jgi:hypothetical protein
MTKKICSKCSIEKNTNEFQKNKYSKDGFRSECSECSKKIKKLKSKEIIKGYSKKYREKHREELNENFRIYYLINKEKENERSKNYREKLKINKENVFVEQKEPSIPWRIKNKILFYNKRKEKYQQDVIFRLSINLRNRMNSFLKTKGYKKNSKTFEIIGCSPQQLLEHLENQFVLGMSWSNRHEWHIDHIIPLSSAKDETEIYKLSHYTNLQPLWKEDNLKKGCKIN